jgi:hypothetical protein
MLSFGDFDATVTPAATGAIYETWALKVAIIPAKTRPELAEGRESSPSTSRFNHLSFQQHSHFKRLTTFVFIDIPA